MKTERAIYRPSVEHATPQGVAEFFTEVFAALETRPRVVDVELDFSETAPVAPLILDLKDGEPVFCQRGCKDARADLNGRWLAEHAVPLTMAHTAIRFRLLPAGGMRIKVRQCSSLAFAADRARSWLHENCALGYLR